MSKPHDQKAPALQEPGGFSWSHEAGPEPTNLRRLCAYSYSELDALREPFEQYYRAFMRVAEATAPDNAAVLKIAGHVINLKRELGTLLALMNEQFDT